MDLFRGSCNEFTKCGVSLFCYLVNEFLCIPISLTYMVVS